MLLLTPGPDFHGLLDPLAAIFPLLRQVPFALLEFCATVRARIGGKWALTRLLGFDAITVPFGKVLYVRSH